MTAPTAMIWGRSLASPQGEEEVPLNVFPETLFLLVSGHDQR